MSQWLHGLHDEGGEHLHADKPGWVVITEAIGSDANDRRGRDYRHLTSRGFTPIVRLNNGYSPGGTIPRPSQYADFAKRCANFVAASPGISHVIIGNEPNHAQERPGGDAIYPQMYADCFNQCCAAIKAVAPTVQVITAPIAPWDATTTYPGNASGDWVAYFHDMLLLIPRCDGIGLHTYTHGAGIHLITSSARMQPPFAHRRYEFRAYRDFLEEMPDSKRDKPVYITETDQVDPWTDANTEWVQAAYAEIDAHNQLPGTQRIRCLALYRWDGDQWAIQGKNGVQADFRAAVGKGYSSPIRETNVVNTFIPAISSGTTPTEPSLPPREWDARLTARGVTIETPPLAPGQHFWRVKSARWWNEQESQGRHHIYVNAVDGDDDVAFVDIPFLVTWPSGSAPGRTNGHDGFGAGNFPMSKSLNEFSVKMDDGTPSETVKGIGMGADGNSGIHTSTGVVFELVTMPAATLPAIEAPTPAEPPQDRQLWYVIAPAGANLRQTPDVRPGNIVKVIPYGDRVIVYAQKIAGNGTRWAQVQYQGVDGWVASDSLGTSVPTPPVEPTEPAPIGDKWERTINFILKEEGGYTANDEGAPANFGINQGANPDLDVANITREQAVERYRTKYWRGSGADKLEWPACLFVMNASVQSGQGVAAQLWRESGGNVLCFQGLFQLFYSQINQDSWARNGKAWMARCGRVLLEASK